MRTLIFYIFMFSLYSFSVVSMVTDGFKKPLFPENTSHTKVNGYDCKGQKGDALCASAVRDYFNETDGWEVNYCEFLGNGRFAVNILILNGIGTGEKSAIVTTDCNCEIITD